VLDENGKVIGGISRYHTRNYHHRNFVLVDHSALNQTINHIENANLLAIIDHHHIGGITTDHPILYRNQKVGCTCTIIASMYQENGMLPDHDMAGLLLSAILSDTLHFKSATTTDQDRFAVSWLAPIAGIDDVPAYAREMLGASVALKDSTPHEILNRDLKTYQIGRFQFAIGQTNYSHMEEVQKILPAFKENLQKEQAANGLDLMVMLFTDVMGEGSLFVYYGPLSYVLSDMLQTTFDEHSGFDANIISRKQQLMPRLSQILKGI
jgi:manganese-dependent inorganic pyrophosphatase